MSRDAPDSTDSAAGPDHRAARVGRWWPPLAVAAAAVVVRLVYLVDAADAPTFLIPVVDAGAYDLMARHLAATGEAAARMFWQPFLYPAMLALVYLVSDGSILVVKVLQALLGGATCALTFTLADRRLGRPGAWIAGGIVVLYGPLILFEGELLAAGPATFLGVLLLVVLDASTGSVRRWWWWPVVGAVAALAVLTRPTFLPFVVAAAGWLAWRRARRHGSADAAVSLTLAAVAFAACVLPVAAWSHRVTDRFSFVPASGGLNLYIGNNPHPCETLLVRPGAEWGELISLPEADGAVGVAAQDRWYRARVLEWARSEPLAFLGGLGRKALRLLSSRELPRNLDVYLMRRWSVLLQALVWKAGPFGVPFGLLAPLAAVGLALSWRRLGAPLLLFLLLTSAAVVLVFVTARYRLPLVPPLAVTAAAGVVAVADAVRHRRRARLALAAGVAAATLVASTVPGPFCEEGLAMEAELYATLGHAYSERDQPDAAIDAYREALRVDPGLEQVHYNLGKLLAARGDLEAALAAYGEAIRLDPGFAEAHLNLGSLQMRQGRAEAAAEAFRAAAWSDPGMAAAQRGLATALLALNRPEEALTAVQAADTLEPGHGQHAALRGSALLQQGDAQEAAEQLDLAVRAGWDTPLVRLDLGTALLGLGQPRQALEHFDRAAAMDPTLARAHGNAGVALAMTGQLDRAARRFEQAIALEPGFVDARVNLARVLARRGDLDAARRQLEEAARLVPDNAGLRRMLDGLGRGDRP